MGPAVGAAARAGGARAVPRAAGARDAAGARTARRRGPGAGRGGVDVLRPRAVHVRRPRRGIRAARDRVPVRRRHPAPRTRERRAADAVAAEPSPPGADPADRGLAGELEAALAALTPARACVRGAAAPRRPVRAGHRRALGLSEGAVKRYMSDGIAALDAALGTTTTAPREHRDRCGSSTAMEVRHDTELGTLLGRGAEQQSPTETHRRLGPRRLACAGPCAGAASQRHTVESVAGVRCRRRRRDRGLGRAGVHGPGPGGHAGAVGERDAHPDVDTAPSPCAGRPGAADVRAGDGRAGDRRPPSATPAPGGCWPTEQPAVTSSPGPEDVHRQSEAAAPGLAHRATATGARPAVRCDGRGDERAALDRRRGRAPLVRVMVR